MTRRQALAAFAAMKLPAHSCDCHIHIVGDPARFPFAARRGYTPPPATRPSSSLTPGHGTGAIAGRTASG